MSITITLRKSNAAIEDSQSFCTYSHVIADIPSYKAPFIEGLPRLIRRVTPLISHDFPSDISNKMV